MQGPEFNSKRNGKRAPDESTAIARIRAKADEVEMYSSLIGRAWKLVQDVMETTKKLRANAVAVDDMVYMGERLLECQQSLSQGQTIQLAYHYTEPENISRIQTNGLLSRPERRAKGIESHHYHGSAYGEGVYVAPDDPFRSATFGSVGLMVAILPGRSQSSGERYLQGESYDSLYIPRAGFMVLRSSHQCMPLLRFPRDMAWEQADVLHNYHVQMQALLDRHFNDNPTKPPKLQDWLGGCLGASEQTATSHVPAEHYHE